MPIIIEQQFDITQFDITQLAEGAKPWKENKMRRLGVDKVLGRRADIIQKLYMSNVMPILSENKKPRRVWWRDMKKADAERVNHITEAVRRSYITGRVLAGECPQAISLSERRTEIVTESSRIKREQLLEKYGMLLNSTGEFSAEEEYDGQKEAYRSCSSIMDYIGKLEQVDLLTILRYGFINKWLTFTVEKTQTDYLGRVTDYENSRYEGDATCFDFSIDSVSPFLDANMQVMIDVQITADIFYLLISEAAASENGTTYPHTGETVHPMKTQQKYRVRVAFNANDGSLKLKSITSPDADKTVATGWPLDMLLVPVVKPEETEAFCEFVTAYLLSEKYCGDIPKRYHAYRAGMSLPHEHRITLGNTVMARIFFYEGTATCYGDGQEKEIPVFPGTVWIDPVAIEQRTVKWHRLTKGKQVGKDILKKKAEFHEGFHWYTAAPHFCLLRCMDELKGKPAMCYSLTYEVDRQKTKENMIKEAKSPVAYFEMLNDRCEPRIAMPRNVVCSRVEALKEEQKAAGMERTGWTQIIDTLADEFLTSKEATKYRLIELGYNEAQGARNWVNTKNGGFYCAEYVPPANMDRQCVYEISRVEGLREYKNNAAFRRLLRNLPFAYVDGHYVIDSPKYVSDSKYGARLTDYALTHMDECCIPFRKVAMKRIYSAANGFLCHEVLQKKGILTQGEIAESMKKATEAIKLRNEIDTFIDAHRGRGLPAVLDKHINNCSLSAFQIATRANISNHTLTRYREGKSVPDGFTLLKIIIAMELKAGYRRHLFSLLGRNMEGLSENKVVSAILDTNEHRLTVEHWDELIQEIYPEEYNKGFILDNEKRKEVMEALNRKGQLSWGIQLLAS